MIVKGIGLNIFIHLYGFLKIAGYLASKANSVYKKNAREKIISYNEFSRLLLVWNRKKNSRQMPWKGEKDPYKIWLSEIILQQTRVEQGLKYYQNFIKAFPTIHQLANTPDKEIYKLWEGLGYYTRCKNLITTSRYIANKLKGKFPETFHELKKLKGIGPYTASAIASFAFDQPHAVVDGNVFRVLARTFGINKPIDTAVGKKTFTNLANDLLYKKQPGLYNQAIMDFGAVICKPIAPSCQNCPFNKTCYAYINESINRLPVKEKKIRIKKRWFNYFMLEYNNRIIIRQRTKKDIWQQLFEFPMIESESEKSPENLLSSDNNGLVKKNLFDIIEISPLYKQQLSHQLILARFLKVHLKKKTPIVSGYHWVKKQQLFHYAFPRIIRTYMHEKGLI